MSKQSIKIIVSTLIIVIMFGVFKNLFSKNNTQMENLIKEGAFLVDVRTAAEFAEGSAKGATNIPLDQIPNQLDKFKGKKTS